MGRINRRILATMLLGTTALLLCLIGVVRLAFFQRAKYSGDESMYTTYTQEEFIAMKHKPENCIVVEHVNPTRGTIYDDQGRPLVASVRVYSIGIDGRNFNTKHEYFAENSPYLDTLINDLAVKLYKQFHDRYDHNVEYYRGKLSSAFKQHKREQLFFDHEVVVYQKMILDKDIEALEKMPVFSRTIDDKDLGRYGLAGRTKVHFPSVLDKNGKQTVRLRPYGDMGSRILGDPQKKNGIDGCNMFSPILAGVPGERKVLYLDGIALPLSNENPPVEGGDVYTTLNIEIQNIVHQSLMDQCMKAKPAWGCAVVMETATGDIKGISNFERKINGKDTTYLETRNYAMVADVAEPGSTFKLASLLAYLEKTQGNVDIDKPLFQYQCDKFQVGKRIYEKKDKPTYTYQKDNKTSVRRIIQKSSNVGVVNMVRSVFPNFSDYVAKLNEMFITVGFTAQIGKLPHVANLRPDTKIFEEQYSRYFGAAFNMQPMQTLVYYNAVANGGRMMQPRFVKSIRVEGKETLYPPEAIAEQIASKKTISIAQDILHSVVASPEGTAYSTAKKVAPGVSFSGKTGTRDIYDTQLGAYNKNRNSLSFCGYFPADKPQYTCIVYLFDAPSPATSANAITVFANIAKRILNPPATIDSAQKVIRFPHPVRTETLNRINAKYGLGISKEQGNSTYCVSSKDDIKQVKNVVLTQDAHKIPNVVGLNAADAVTELRKSGYSIRMSGHGVVRSQSVNDTDKIITLILSTS